MIEEKLNSENFIIENLKFSYNQKEFLDIPSLELPQHGIIGVIGFNGSGKSTFSNCMCGLVKKAKGTLLYGNQIFGAKERIKKCFMVMQDVNHQLFTDSVKEEIAISINDDEEGAESRICEIGKRLHLEAFMELHPMSLSGGEKQRVAIASAIAADRDILILDEPTSGLDYRHMMEVSNELKRLSKIGKTIFVITHDPELINLSCNYFIFLDKGKVKWYGGRTKEILSKVENFFRDGEN
nr:ATP-binding cassette domain-containing protein [Treponema phagedenis]